jgi:hypothetical protein
VATNWSIAYVAGWVAICGVLLVYELAALRSSTDRLPPLTHVLKRWVPSPIVLGFVAWLAAHFAETYGWLPGGFPDLAFALGVALVVAAGEVWRWRARRTERAERIEVGP